MESSSLVPVTTSQSLPPARRLFVDAFNFYKTHFTVIAAIGLVPVVLNLFGIITENISAGVSIIFSLLAFVAGVFAWLAFFDVVRADGAPEGGVKGAYIHSKQLIAPYAWILLLQNLAIAGGIFLLVIPGIIFSILLGQSVYAYIFENKRGMDALVTSWHYVRGNWWRVLWRMFFVGIVIVVLNTIVIAVVGLGLGGGEALRFQEWGGMTGNMGQQQEFARSLQTAGRFTGFASGILTNIFFLPFSVIYLSLLYRALQSVKSGAALSEEERVKMRKTLKIFIGIAIAGIAILLIAFGFFFSWLLQYLLDPNAGLPRGNELMPTGFSAGVGISPLFHFFR